MKPIFKTNYGSPFHHPNVKKTGKIPVKNSLEEWFPQRHCFTEQFLKFLTALPADINMVVRPKQAGLQLPVRCHAEPVAECTELGIVTWADDLDFSTVKAVLFPVMHPSGDDQSGPGCK